jgi:serine protease Do
MLTSCINFSKKTSLFFIILLLSSSGFCQNPQQLDFTDIVDRVSASVVNIQTKHTIKDYGSPMDLFREFFGQGQGQGQARPGMPGPQGPGGRMPDKDHKRYGQALGSGFIIDEAGYVVTNNHVVEDAEEITVQLHNDRKYKAKLIGRDSKTDLAVIKIETKERLVALRWANSDIAKVGEWVLAIGFPFRLGKTVTAGIISALAREIGGPYDDYIQTDASINVGNSGGPLVNLRGEVTGVNAAILSPSGTNAGIGFAISSNLAKTIVDQLIKSGKISRGWIGVVIQKINPDVAKAMGLKSKDGAMVRAIDDGGPAHKAGIHPGDVVIEFNGKSIKDSNELARVVAETDIGKSVKLKVLRKEGAGAAVEKVLNIVTQDRSIGEKEFGIEDNRLLPDESAKGKAEVKELGITVMTLSSELRRRFDIDKKVRGLVIIDISPYGSARGNAQVGDVITHIGGARKPVKSIADLEKGIEEAKKAGAVLLTVNSKGRENFFGIPIPEEYRK